MATVKKTIGRLPVYKGDWVAGTYSMLNQVSYLGSTFQSKIDNNTSQPATLVNNVLQVNSNWNVISNGTAAYLADSRLTSVEGKTVQLERESSYKGILSYSRKYDNNAVKMLKYVSIFIDDNNTDDIVLNSIQIINGYLNIGFGKRGVSLPYQKVATHIKQESMSGMIEIKEKSDKVDIHIVIDADAYNELGEYAAYNSELKVMTNKRSSELYYITFNEIKYIGKDYNSPVGSRYNIGDKGYYYNNLGVRSYYDSNGKSWGNTGYINVLPGERFYVVATSNRSVSTAAFFDASKQYISSVVGTVDNIQYNVDVVIPEGVSYVIFSTSWENPYNITRIKDFINIIDTPQYIYDINNKLSEVYCKQQIFGQFNGYATTDHESSSWEQRAESMYSNINGLSNLLTLKKYCSISNRVLEWVYKPDINAQVIVCTSSAKLESFHSQGTMISIDYAEGVVNIHNKWGGVSGTDTNIPTVIKSYQFDKLNHSATKYVCSISRNNRGFYFLLKKYNGEKLCEFNIEYEPAIVQSYGMLYDYMSIGTISNGVEVYRMTVSAYVPFNTLLYIVGDSITEGVPDAQYNGWAYRVAGMAGNTVVSGRGGAKIESVIRRIEDEAKLIKPTYIMVTIGANGGNTTSKIVTLINAIKEIGATPIINRIPLSGNTDHSAINNDIIKSGCIGANLDEATSIGGVVSNGIDLRLYTSDKLHLNTSGNTACYEKIKEDLSFLFQR